MVSTEKLVQLALKLPCKTAVLEVERPHMLHGKPAACLQGIAAEVEGGEPFRKGRQGRPRSPLHCACSTAQR